MRKSAPASATWNLPAPIAPPLHIYISDDEDETHPNIDTPSLFRWRHQARIERMEEQKRERELFEKTKKE
ncbi:unnamed protein product [Timema podura]|uniref:Cdc37 N-terminal domain-containing protein n=1 Tax=Timema podura TaxID=61482 RepID=A0ABN7PFL3_TIMPD|nr:unnamed protein product [Timema podura]